MKGVRIEWLANRAKGNIVGMFDLLYGSFRMMGFKLMKGAVDKDQLWVSMPSHQIGPANNRRWVHSCWIPEKGKKDKFEEWVIGEYYKEVKGD